LGLQVHETRLYSFVPLLILIVLWWRRILVTLIALAQIKREKGNLDIVFAKCW